MPGGLAGQSACWSGGIDLSRSGLAAEFREAEAVGAGLAADVDLATDLGLAAPEDSVRAEDFCAALFLGAIANDVSHSDSVF